MSKFIIEDVLMWKVSKLLGDYKKHLDVVNPAAATWVNSVLHDFDTKPRLVENGGK